MDAIDPMIKSMNCKLIGLVLVGILVVPQLSATEISSILAKNRPDQSGNPEAKQSISQASSAASTNPAVETDAFIARVVEVLSGDQLVMMLPSGTQLEVNLAGVQAPDRNSQYYRQSRSWLRSQLEGQLVSAECGKSIGTGLECAIFPDDREINLVSLYHGLSTCNGRGSVLHDAGYYKKIENMAKNNKSGLWSSQ